MIHRMRRARRVGDERGSISIWVVLVAPAMIILAGLAVDGGGTVHAEQHATHLAEQAARVGGQQLRTGDAIRGVRAAPDTTKAAAAVSPADQIAKLQELKAAGAITEAEFEALKAKALA